MLARRVLVPGFVLFISMFSTDASACHWYGVLDLGLHGRRDHASLKKQNRVADLHGLERLDEQKLQEYIAQGKLERLADPPFVFYYLDIAEDRFQYALPETKIFAEMIAYHFYKKFGKPLKFTSFVRSREHQAKLERPDRNGKKISDADSKDPELQSAHLTGAAFDISRRDLGFWEKRWICRVIQYWKDKNMVEGIEEWKNNAFHIMVFPSYGSSFLHKDEWDELKEKPRGKTRGF